MSALQRYRRSLRSVGLVFALVFFGWSMTPSLLPRPWYLQGVATGICAASGYGFGVGLAWLTRRLGFHPRWSATTRRRGDLLLAAVSAVYVPTALVLGAHWQEQVRAVVGVESEGRPYYGLVVLIATVLAATLRELARLARAAARGIGRFGTRFVPARIARAGGAVAVAVLTVMIVNGALYNAFLTATNAGAAAVDRGDHDHTVRPVAAERSGSPGTPVPWESLGREGRSFVGGGPTVADLGRFGGRPATAPIRVYAGLSTAPSVAEVADVVVDELERTGGFDRAVLAVATTTGTGWVDPQAADALEYLYAGDTAIAAMQYSYLPSAASFVADRETPRAAGRELFDRVYAAWERRPAHARPRLVVFGQSLGSYGGQSAFSGVQDMTTRTDAALWIGTPNSTAVWSDVTAARDPGSAQRLPVVDGGREVRFAAQPDDLDLAAPWGGHRVVYLQHASDPVVWWSPDLLTRRPDWLAEPLAADVSPQMTWFPAVTFWQVSMDLIFSVDVPAGHGHHYGPVTLEVWDAMLEAPGWSAADSARYLELHGGAAPSR